MRPLAAAGGVWQSAKADMGEGEMRDGVLVPPEELKKVAKWLQQTVTKFGASAAVADGPADKALVPIGEEVIRALTAAVQTMVCLTRGAGASLRAEVNDIGASLAAAVQELGAAVGTPSLGIAAGKVLDRVKHLERMSSQNRAAIRRRLLRDLSQVSDVQRELQQALEKAGGTASPGDDDEDEDDFAPSDDVDFEPGERELVEAVAGAVEVFLELLREASRLCVPPSGSPSNAAAAAAAAAAEVPVEVLEASAVHADNAAKAVDEMVVHSVGGLDAKAFTASLRALQASASGLEGWPKTPFSLPEALGRVQAALEAVPTD